MGLGRLLVSTALICAPLWAGELETEANDGSTSVCGHLIVAEGGGEYSEVVAKQRDGVPTVQYVGENFPTLQLVDYPWLKTKGVINKKGLAPIESEAIVVMWHGWGGTRRGMGSNLSALRVFTAPEAETGFVKKVRTAAGAVGENHVELGGLTYDFPGHGHSQLFKDAFPEGEDALDIVCETVAKDLQRIRDLYNKKVIVFARSAGPALAFEMQRRHPGLISGLIGVSASHSDPAIDEKVVQAIRERIDSGALASSESLFEWTNHLYRLMSWHRWEDPTNGVPTLLLSGTEDAQNPIEARQDYDRLAHRWPHIEHITLEGAGHDVLSTGSSNRANMNAGYAEIYKFIREITGR